MTSVSDPSGRVWLVSRRLLHRPRVPRRLGGRSFSDRLDVVGNMDFGHSLSGLVVGVVAVILVIAMLELLPFVILAVEFAVLAGAGGVHALLGRRIVVAESDGDVWMWTVKGQPASARLTARVVAAVRDGSAFPAGGAFERVAPAGDDPRG